ncbi:MAG: hypothetical protein WC359_14545 [Dehalococcoidia bacterium]|jgi:hypothetical protein
MIMDASPLQLTVGTIGLFLLLLIWVYLAARLGAHGVARSWWEFFSNKKKEGKRHDRKRED